MRPSTGPMRIGLDFDNTIVTYDALFHSIALQRGHISPTTPVSKEAVRDAFRTMEQEETWTRLQGEVYGTRMNDVPPFPGVIEFLQTAIQLGHTVFIISHKTKAPYLGPPHDLHAAATGWITENLGHLISSGHLAYFLEHTKLEKLKRIEQERCEIFIDDLPEILLAPEFPVDTMRVHFDPSGIATRHPELRHLVRWDDALTLILESSDG